MTIPQGRARYFEDDDGGAEPRGLERASTGRFGLATVRERGSSGALARGTGREPPPSFAHGTPAPVRIGRPALTDPAIQIDLASLEGPTHDHEPLAAGLVEEDAPLDRDATERALLAAIAEGDEPARLAYAGWLEERSEHARAGFLRLELLVSKLAPDDPRREHCARQLRELGPHIGLDWRARVARPPIEGCAAAAGRCPRRWDALARTRREDVRPCGPCGKHVYYFETVDEAREAAARGQCVAIDASAERWEADLVDPGTRCGHCERRVVSRARFCPHCGASISASIGTSLGGAPGGSSGDALGESLGDATELVIGGLEPDA